MKYIDLHCDALTKTEGVFQVTREKLKEGGCLLQCFAAFIEGTENRFARTAALAETFQAMCRLEGYNVVRSFSDLRADRINAMFTVEEGGAVEGSIEKLEALYACGARMLTLTWNYPNEIGYPNFPDYDAVLMRAPQGGIRGGGSPYLRETVLGLTPFGFEAVERMQQLGMIVDVSFFRMSPPSARRAAVRLWQVTRGRRRSARGRAILRTARSARLRTAEA